MEESSPATSRTTAAEESIVYVIDDDRLMLGALNTLFRSIELGVKTFSSATEFLQHTLPAMPSCLVLDIRMPRLSGLDLQAELGRQGINMPVIFITGHGDVPMTVRAMKAGAQEFLTKPFSDEVLLAAIRHALERSRIALGREMELQGLKERFASLTGRERQVMALVATGKANKQVGSELGISEITVKAHRGKVMEKMKADSIADLVRMAAKLRLSRASGVPAPRA
jgi:FixJ family two-component response regulator